jgi:hypothetical protein
MFVAVDQISVSTHLRTPLFLLCPTFLELRSAASEATLQEKTACSRYFSEQAVKVKDSTIKLTVYGVGTDISKTPSPWVAARRILPGLCNFRSNTSTSGNPVPYKAQVLPPSVEA